MKIAIVIPARYASTRLPGKPLLDIEGKAMIQHVFERASELNKDYEVIVATDDVRIVQAVEKFGGRAELTSVDHNSGTDRMIELLDKIDADILLNIQGDEPLIRSADLKTLIESMLQDEAVEVGTLCHEIDWHEAKNLNSVKVVLADNKDVLYFSRSIIPYFSSSGVAERSLYLKHIGVYAFRRTVLIKFGALSEAFLESAERLEQLRLLSAGIKIRALKVEPMGPGVDTPESLDIVRQIFRGKPLSMRTPSLCEQLQNIKLVITDVDGVLTDGSIFYTENGETLKRFHVRDGLGMKMLEETGVRVVVLSGKDSPSLRKRVADLQISNGFYGIKNKQEVIQSVQEEYGITKAETLTIGDDSIDLPAFAQSGLCVVVNDAEDYIKDKADVVLSKAGGYAAFREVADMILRAQGKGDILDSVSGYAKIMSKMVQ